MVWMKWFGTLGLALALSLGTAGLVGCEQDTGDHLEDAMEDVQDAGESAGDAAEQAIEDTEEAIED